MHNDAAANLAPEAFSKIFTHKAFDAYAKSWDYENSHITVFMNGRSGTGKTSLIQGYGSSIGLRHHFFNAMEKKHGPKYQETTTFKLVVVLPNGIFDAVANWNKTFSLWCPLSPKDDHWAAELNRAPAKKYGIIKKHLLGPGTSVNPDSTRYFSIETWYSEDHVGKITFLDFPGPESIKEIENKSSAMPTKSVLTGRDLLRSSSFINTTNSTLLTYLTQKKMPKAFGYPKMIMSIISGADDLKIVTTGGLNIKKNLTQPIISLSLAVSNWWRLSHVDQDIVEIVRSPRYPVDETIEEEAASSEQSSDLLRPPTVGIR